MSLTEHIKKRTLLYWQIVSMLNLEYCRGLLNHHSQICGPVIHKPIPGTNFPLAGISVIYAVRDFLGGQEIWGNTFAGKYYNYPAKSPEPIKWVVMGLMDAQCRRNDYAGDPGHIKSLHPDFSATAQDVEEIASSFQYILRNNKGKNVIPNPCFPTTIEVGGADANLIVDSTLWDIRTTAKNSPLDLDCIVQQVGYFLLDLDNKYQLDSICWYYTRQQSLFQHPIEPLLTKGAKLRFQRMLEAM
jgi:hypothetical protein